MGRWSFNSKKEADYLNKISIFWLKKNEYLIGYKVGIITWSRGETNTSSIRAIVDLIDKNPYLRLQYLMPDYQGQKEEIDYKIMLATTPCNFGGKRYWFVCPLLINGKYCGRRVGVLFCNGKYFGCRHCQNLIYSSQKENRNIKLNPFLSVLKIENKIEELEKEIQRESYKGKPTKKQKRLNQLYQQKLDNVVLLTRNKMV